MRMSEAISEKDKKRGIDSIMIRKNVDCSSKCTEDYFILIST